MSPKFAAAALAGLALAGPVRAEGHDGRRPGHPYGPHAGRTASAPMPPPEIRYRDPRYRPPLRRGPPVDLIEAYLPRTTETPMYNEPRAVSRGAEASRQTLARRR